MRLLLGFLFILILSSCEEGTTSSGSLEEDVIVLQTDVSALEEDIARIDEKNLT